jgi:hypothetical protein
VPAVKLNVSKGHASGQDSGRSGSQ